MLAFKRQLHHRERGLGKTEVNRERFLLSNRCLGCQNFQEERLSTDFAAIGLCRGILVCPSGAVNEEAAGGFPRLALLYISKLI